MDANTILDALKPATGFILECLKRNGPLAVILSRVGLDAIEELPENPLAATQKLEDRFDAKKLLSELQSAFSAGGDIPIRTGELEAIAIVAQVLLDIQRYYRWKELSYANRAIRAASHRTINALPTGPVVGSLQTAVDRTLQKANL